MNANFSTASLMRRFQQVAGLLVLSFFSFQQVAHAAPVVGKKLLSTASVNHAGTRVEFALLTLSANPYALSANAGKQTVRFSVPVRSAVAYKSPATVFLRHRGDKQSIAMNDLGKNGDYVAKDGIHGVSVQIDTAKVKPDSCLYYETYVKQGRAEIVSQPLRLCVSSFPVRVAAPSIDKPVVLDDGVKAVADEVLLYAKPTTSAATIRELAHSINARVVGSIIPLNLYQLRLPAPVSAKRLLEIIAQLNTRAEIAGAAVNALGQPAGHVDITTDPEFANQHGVKLVLKHPTLADTYVWDAGAIGTGVTVVVADEGMDPTHPEFGISGDCQLSQVPVSGFAISDCGGTNNDNAVPGNLQWHGTRVAGVIAAKAYNTLGIAGVAHGSKIYSYKVASYAVADMDQIFTDMVPYVSAGASVINASFSGGPWSGVGYTLNVNALCTAVDSAVSSGFGAIAVIAAGNTPETFSGSGILQNPDNWYYPARCNQHANVSVANRNRIIAVGNSTSVVTANCGSVAEDQRCAPAVPFNANLPGSNYGAWVDITAPGSDIRTTTKVGAGDGDGNNYTISTGTSFSTPIVSGAVAILKSCGVLLDQIKSTLISSANVNVPYPTSGSLTTTPRLDVYRALNQANHTPTGVLPASSSVNENSLIGTPIGTLSANDVDTCDKFTYSVTGANPGGFVVDANTGALGVGNVALDYEAVPSHSYTLTVQATDFFGLSATTPVTVNLNDRNDNAPVITTAATQSVNENAAFSVALTSTDADTVGTNPATFTITGGADQTLFSIVGGNLTMAAKNFEVPTDADVNNTHVVQVTANDGVNNTVQTITVTVTNLSEAPTGNPSITGERAGVPVTDGTRKIGDILTADTTPIVNPDSWVVSTYQWKRSDTPPPGDIPVVITNANSSTYTLVYPDDDQKYMSVCVTYTGVSTVILCSGTDAVAVGDPHMTTVDGLNYDFQGAGEFVALRGTNGMEIQLRQTPVSTAGTLTDGYSGLSVGVSINTAVAARVGSHRVTFQPNISGNAASGGLELRVDRVVTTLPANGLDLGSGGRVTSSPGGGIQIDFPDGTTMIATPGWWVAHNVWYLNVSVLHTSAYDGLMGARTQGSWLPRLSDGSSLGARPVALPDRYADLYVKFADSWRVNNETSLFDYARNKSTKTFTFAAWPKEKPPYVIPQGGPVAKPLKRQVAQRLCRPVVGKNNNADCVFDVMVTGNPGFAKTYLLSQKIQAGLTSTIVRDDKDPSKPSETVTFTATVARNATITSRESGRKGALAGKVQFTLDGERVGKPIKLDSKGQARWKVSSLKVGKHRIAARYIPSKGSAFLPSSSLDESHSVTEKH